MATIKDVAILAGVSTCTVSRALANKGYIKLETKNLILKAAKQLHYRPNYSAQSLKYGNTRTIGLIVPDITNPYYPKITKSIENYLQKIGYTLILGNTGEQVTKEKKIIETFKRHNVDGVIALPCSKDVKHIQSLSNSGIPYVFLNRNIAGEKHTILTDNYFGGYTMVKFLIENGHRRIGIIIPNFDNQIYEERFIGAKSALAEYDLLKSNQKYFLLNVHNVQIEHGRVCNILRCQERPTAFFAANDMLGIGIYGAIWDCGLKIPDDVSVVGYDDISIDSLMFPPLTTFLQEEDKIAEKAVNHLICLIEHRQTKETECLKGKIIIRDSVKNLLK